VALIEREADVIGKRGTTRFEAVLNYVGLSGETPDIVRRAIYELQQIRHCIVHNGARADTQLLAACPWLSLSLGDDIRVSSRQFSSFTGSANYYAYELYRRTKVKHGGDAATTEERLSNLLTALKPLQDERAGEVEA
jgi:hypothetical protein